MNDNYLRKKKPAVRLLQNSLFRIFGRKGIWKIGIIIVILSFVLFGNRGVLQRINLELEKKQMIERLEAEEKVTGFLREQLQRATTDDAYIEKIARERHGMIRSGETVYRITNE